MRRTLTLKKETLAELTPVELRRVAGGGGSTDCPDPPSNVCLESYQVMCVVSRMMDVCPTEPTFGCP